MVQMLHDKDLAVVYHNKDVSIAISHPTNGDRCISLIVFAIIIIVFFITAQAGKFEVFALQVLDL